MLYSGILKFTDTLAAEKIPFGVIGGLAVFTYGGQRATFDVDLLVDGHFKQRTKDIALKLGFKLANETTEFLQLTGATQLDIMFANRELSQNMLLNTQKVESFPLPILSPEDLIGLKIQGFCNDRSREIIDKGDILTLVRVVKDIDVNKIKKYADMFNVWKEIEEILSKK